MGQEALNSRQPFAHHRHPWRLPLCCEHSSHWLLLRVSMGQLHRIPPF